jgi:hypothetical protein
MRNKLMKKTVLLIILVTVAVFGVWANDDLFMVEEDLFGGEGDDLDALFGDSGSLVEDVVETEIALDEVLLINESGVVIGGNYSFSITPGWAWNLEAETNSGSFSTSLQSELYFDARPNTDIRVYGDARISYPFETTADDAGTPQDESRGFDDIVKINELFSDFTIHDTLFVRAGKQTINWGVGYFFSPADLLNLAEIDPSDPDADLEGPVSVMINAPIEVDNLYGYLIIPENTRDVTDLAVAAKYEKVIGGTEVGIGGYYRDGQPPAGMLTVSTNIADISVFGEGVIQYGSDKEYLTGSLFSPVIYENPDDVWYLSGTVGTMFSLSDDESGLSLSFVGQYFYNGEGYSGEDLIALPGGTSGLHYSAVNLSVTLTDTVSSRVFWYGNLSDGSGFVSPSLSWRPADYVGINVGMNYNYGGVDGGEFAPIGDMLSASLSLSLGGAGF